MSQLWTPYPVPEWGYAFHIDDNFEWGTHDLRIIERRDGKSFAGVLKFGEHEPGERMEPTLRVKHNDATGLQALFDSLWEAGFRPPTGVDPQPIVQAKNENLADLRRILDKVMAP